MKPFVPLDVSSESHLQSELQERESAQSSKEDARCARVTHLPLAVESPMLLYDMAAG